jgi:hypothetical protein
VGGKVHTCCRDESGCGRWVRKGGGGDEDLSLDELSKIHSHKGDK